MRRIQSDVLVIGGGGSGIMAAIWASRSGSRVALVSKGKLMRCGATVMAPGAMAATDIRWGHPKDSAYQHLVDTCKGGAWLNNQELVKIVVEEAGDMALNLEEMGVMFQRAPGGLLPDLRRTGGHSFSRSLYLENRVGHEIMRGLSGELSRLQVPVYEEIMITRLLKDDRGITGAVGFSVTDQELILFESPAVILATGGSGMLYLFNDNSTDLTGDGYALAMEAGASLTDMEFVQMYPIGFLSPTYLRGVLGGYAFVVRLYNSLGERFMRRYDPERLELTTRDKLCQAIMTEVREGRGSPLGGVFCGLDHLPERDLMESIPLFLNTLKRAGINPLIDRYEIAPTCHFFMGGVLVGNQWEVCGVTGLYSVGECAGGIHGANRVGQNALTEVLVSASIAGKAAANYARGKGPVSSSANEVSALAEYPLTIRRQNSGISPAKLRLFLQNLMHENAGVVRTRASLEQALAEIRRLAQEPAKIASESPVFNREVVEYLENRNLLMCAQSVVLSAMWREESRGSHYRADFPACSDSRWLKNTTVSLINNKMEVRGKDVLFPYCRPEEVRI